MANKLEQQRLDEERRMKKELKHLTKLIIDPKEDLFGESFTCFGGEAAEHGPAPPAAPPPSV